MLDTKQRPYSQAIKASSGEATAGGAKRLSIGQSILALVVAAPVALMFLFVAHYGVNLPYMDEWNFAALAVKSASGHMQLVDLLKAQNNEHMLAVPYALMLSVSTLTRYNSVALMLTSAVVMAMIDLLWCYLGWRLLATKYGTTRTLLALVPVSLLVSSIRQYENLLWGFQVQIALLMLLSMVTVILLDKAKRLDSFFAASMITAAMCTYSFANGLFIWPTGVFLMLLKARTRQSNERRPGQLMMAVWLAVGITFVASYFLLREASSWTDSQHGSVQLLVHRPKVFLLYLMTIFGNPLTFTRDMAIAAGSLLTFLALTVFPSIKGLLRRFKQTPVLLSILLFSVFACLVVCAGRVGSAYGIEQALVSRYCTMVTPGIVSLYLLCLASTNEARPWSRIRALMTSLLVLVGVLYTVADSLAQANEVQATRIALIGVVRNYRAEGQANLALLAPNTEQVKQVAAGLERCQLNSFAH